MSDQNDKPVALIGDALFLAYQSRLMAEVWAHQVVVYEKSRRTGVSWCASFIADLFAGLDPRQGGMDVFYMGYNLEMAREFIDYCAEHAAAMQAVAGAVNETFWNDPDHPEKDVKIFRIDMASGNKILTLPSVPRALRGMQGLVIIDEAAFHDDLAEVLKAALALLMWGGKVVIISTHNGDTNPFNVLVQDVRAGRRPYRILRTTFDDALDDGLYRKICEKSGEDWSPEAQAQWRQEIVGFYGDAAAEELFCIPSPSSGAYIPLVLIEQRTVADTPVLRWSCDATFDDAMRNVLLGDGMSTFLVGQDGTVTIERAVSTSQMDANGNATTAWRDVMVHATISRIRYEWNLFIETTYPRAKLADDGSALANVATAGVVTPSILKNSWVGQSKLYENQGWIENTSTLSKQARFILHPTDRNRVDCALPVQVIGSLIVVATSIQMQV
ncbi:Mu-like prophage FluMu protein gp28 [Acetobacter estunensis NRIC 0472]|uniref:hypothetical protein n=1 Tax=Acetobacter estunensis TaxID=104097 RepID=UPI001F54FD4E|nr:hypothetical protein [Acetobacter estunensis]GBQ23500.1 Mu-like prophage FluMu protein gp28 [Acetobacter estunensis NRIC 0472]